MAEILKYKRQILTVSVNFLDKMFSMFGVPETILSDNWTEFTSNKFTKFCEFYSIEHITTPEYHRISNGQVERFV